MGRTLILVSRLARWVHTPRLGLFAAVGILFACLWPFHGPANAVSWRPEGFGVEFRRPGTLLGETLSLPGEAAIELWLEPDNDKSSNAILAFWNPQEGRRLLLRQDYDRIELRNITQGSVWRQDSVGLTASNILAKHQPTFLTLVFGSNESLVYANGELVHTGRAVGFTGGQLILGTSPVSGDTWPGEILGLALYRARLDPTEIAAHYRAWTVHRKPPMAPSCAALYLFGEGRGNTVRNHCGPGALTRPERYVVIDKALLEPFWREFRWEPSYWLDIVLNVGGFSPVGFALWSYARGRFWAWPGLLTVASCFALSLSIELLQGFLPTRDSSMTDVMTNITGGWLGALACRWAAGLTENPTA